eukprot:TRINITY_DN21880_c0_g1_i1.p1 TRINITY_DN21880_c0_g1~~TRINITY_DN21880_c0_g1_i1.p1  ORF type:complete len:295 (-),score=48.14 TRINITY_DN21880_c0_g1_i1:555-1439(-)
MVSMLQQAVQAAEARLEQEGAAAAHIGDTRAQQRVHDARRRLEARKLELAAALTLLARWQGKSTQMITIDVVFMSGDAVTMDLAEDATVEELRTLVHWRLDIHPSEQYLIFQGELLADPTMALQKLHIQEGSQLSLTILDHRERSRQKYEEAVDHVIGLDAADIRHFRSNTSHSGVMSVLLCVLIIRPRAPISHEEAPTNGDIFASEAAFLAGLQAYDPDLLSSHQAHNVELLMRKLDAASAKDLKAFCSAGYAILEWVQAVLEYYHSHRDEQPVHQAERSTSSPRSSPQCCIS